MSFKEYLIRYSTVFLYVGTFSILKDNNYDIEWNVHIFIVGLSTVDHKKMYK